MMPAAAAAAAVKPIRRLVVANRGEIACRIIKTARRMNIETLAVYSEADRNSMHVQLADQAHQVGAGSEPQRSYLNQDELLRVARQHQADAIHPGYGFLSENAEFAARCSGERVLFVGPRAESIRSMGIKSESKRIMIAAGVPVVPGYHGDEQTDGRLSSEAQSMGYPILIKPVRGGGGKGMRIVTRPADFLEALESARRESLKSFNDQSMLLEKYIERPRHIEVQVFGDTQGNFVYLFERDCSLQRRHQKIVEEAPAPGLSESKRHELGQLALAAARAVDYLGAGTVEFIMDRDTGQFYFMEMNTRLQVEHPVTEMITRTDLVEWQLRVASGEPLPRRQADIQLQGHALEARIYAEEPGEQFLPQVGELEFVALPGKLGAAELQQGDQLRLDTGVRQGDSISPYYDPMIAKLIVWGRDRSEALARLNGALADYVVVGLPTNVDFLRRLVQNSSFGAAELGTDFIENHQDELFASDKVSEAGGIIQLSELQVAQVGAAVSMLLGAEAKRLAIRDSLRSFRQLGQPKPAYQFQVDRLANNVEGPFDVRYSALDANGGLLTIAKAEDNDHKILFSGHIHTKADQQTTLVVSLNEGRDQFKFVRRSPALQSGQHTKLVLRNESLGETQQIWFRSKSSLDQRAAPGAGDQIGEGDPLQARAPMPGLVERLLVLPGQSVELGDSLLVLSAMKMEYTIRAAQDGRVAELLCKQGDFVAKQALLVRLEQPDTTSG